jgi:quercetin 2,3-dioxygenase
MDVWYEENGLVMITLRSSHERGHAQYDWLDTHYSFSFADYYDPKHVHFRALRVMNEDRIAPGKGFGTHPHDNMEILTYVIEGALEHRDSMGNGEVLHAGEFQRISAGSGITHSEFNPSSTDPVHLYQIWLFPKEKDIEPSYEQKGFDLAKRQNRFQCIASPDRREGSLVINQDAVISLCVVTKGCDVVYPLDENRHAWLQVIRGSVQVGSLTAQAGDGVAVTSETEIAIKAFDDEAEVLLFDLY